MLSGSNLSTVSYLVAAASKSFKASAARASFSCLRTSVEDDEALSAFSCAFSFAVGSTGLATSFFGSGGAVLAGVGSFAGVGLTGAGFTGAGFTGTGFAGTGFTGTVFTAAGFADAGDGLAGIGAGAGAGVGFSDSAAEQIQRWLPDAKVVKAFNIIGHAHMVNPQFLGGPPDMFICGNDTAAKKVVGDICRAFGWNVIDIGGIQGARLLEPLAMLWITVALGTKQGNHAFKLLRK